MKIEKAIHRGLWQSCKMFLVIAVIVIACNFVPNIIIALLNKSKADTSVAPLLFNILFIAAMFSVGMTTVGLRYLLCMGMNRKRIFKSVFKANLVLCICVSLLCLLMVLVFKNLTNEFIFGISLTNAGFADYVFLFAIFALIDLFILFASSFISIVFMRFGVWYGLSSIFLVATLMAANMKLFYYFISWGENTAILLVELIVAGVLFSVGTYTWGKRIEIFK